MSEQFIAPITQTLPLKPELFLLPSKPPTVTAWNPVNTANWTDESHDEDVDKKPFSDANNGNNHLINTDDEDNFPNNNDDNLTNSTNHSNGADELSYSQAEDALFNLHNLLY